MCDLCIIHASAEKREFDHGVGVKLIVISQRLVKKLNIYESFQKGINVNCLFFLFDRNLSTIMHFRGLFLPKLHLNSNCDRFS